MPLNQGLIQLLTRSCALESRAVPWRERGGHITSEKERYGLNITWEEQVAGKWAEYDPFLPKKKKKKN